MSCILWLPMWTMLPLHQNGGSIVTSCDVLYSVASQVDHATTASEWRLHCDILRCPVFCGFPGGPCYHCIRMEAPLWHPAMSCILWLPMWTMLPLHQNGGSIVTSCDVLYSVASHVDHATTASEWRLHCDILRCPVFCGFPCGPCYHCIRMEAPLWHPAMSCILWLPRWTMLPLHQNGGSIVTSCDVLYSVASHVDHATTTSEWRLHCDILRCPVFCGFPCGPCYHYIRMDAPLWHPVLALLLCCC